MFKGTVIILLSIFMSSTAHVFLKKGMMTQSRGVKTEAALMKLWLVATDWWVITGIFLHVIALAVWLLALERFDVTFAYPFLALGYVIVSMLAYFWLGEQISLQRALGMIIVVFGLLVISRTR